MKGKKKTLEKKLKYKKITKKKNLQEKGITLIALVVTIIILLILAGVTLNIALSDNGLFSKAKTAADEYNQKSIEEKLQILYAERQLENYENGTNEKIDVTELLEEKTGEGKITEKDIKEFNDQLKQYGYEEVKTISSDEEIAKIGKDDAHPIDGIYVQLGDIESLTLTTPIGTEENPFTGVYNGNGKKIQNLNIESTERNVGIFGVNNGTIKNLKIENGSIISDNNVVGAIVGLNNGKIENCINKSNVTGKAVVGGIAGRSRGSIKLCSNEGLVSSSVEYDESEIFGSDTGGIAGGLIYGGLISSCFNKGKISGNKRAIGGICGRLDINTIIQESMNEGNVTGYYGLIGGICGVSRGKILQVYNKGMIKNENDKLEVDAHDTATGGLVGWIVGNSALIDSYNTGSVDGKGYCGGAVGILDAEYQCNPNLTNCYNSGDCVFGDNRKKVGLLVGLVTERTTKIDIINCYYKKTTDDDKGVNELDDEVNSFEGKSEEELKNQSTFKGWDFKSIWKIDTGKTPYLEFSFLN